MVDIDKIVQFWRDSAVEDWEVAVDLVQRGRVRHGLFMSHLAVEKTIKAIVCRKTGALAPKLHDLVRLTELAALTPSPDQLSILADLNLFQLEGRYPDRLAPAPTVEEATQHMNRTAEILKWLQNRF